VNGINVASQQLTGQTASSPTDLSQLNRDNGSSNNYYDE